MAALRAARTHGPPISDVAFSFVMSRADGVRVTLAMLTTGGGRGRWRSVASVLRLHGHAGRNHARMRGAFALAPGQYRLELAPVGGRPRSIDLTVG